MSNSDRTTIIVLLRPLPQPKQILNTRALLVPLVRPLRLLSNPTNGSSYLPCPKTSIYLVRRLTTKPTALFLQNRQRTKKNSQTCLRSGFQGVTLVGSDMLCLYVPFIHSFILDIGGGAVADDIDIALSDITLRWMVRQVMASQCGIQFEEDALARAMIPKTTFPPGTATVAGGEELKLDLPDAIAPLHDQLKIFPLWWFLEIIPMHYSWQDEAGVWHESFGSICSCFPFWIKTDFYTFSLACILAKDA